MFTNKGSNAKAIVLTSAFALICASAFPGAALSKPLNSDPGNPDNMRKAGGDNLICRKAGKDQQECRKAGGDQQDCRKAGKEQQQKKAGKEDGNQDEVRKAGNDPFLNRDLGKAPELMSAGSTKPAAAEIKVNVREVDENSDGIASLIVGSEHPQQNRETGPSLIDGIVIADTNERVIDEGSDGVDELVTGAGENDGQQIDFQALNLTTEPIGRPDLLHPMILAADRLNAQLPQINVNPAPRPVFAPMQIPQQTEFVPSAPSPVVTRGFGR